MSQKQHWILLLKAHFLLLLFLQSLYLVRCQTSKPTPSESTLKYVGRTDVTKLSTVTDLSSRTGDIGDTGTSSAFTTVTGSPDYRTEEIQPTPSSVFHTGTEQSSDLTGETTPVLPSQDFESTVLPPLSTVTVQSSDMSELLSKTRDSFTQPLTESTLFFRDTTSVQTEDTVTFRTSVLLLLSSLPSSSSTLLLTPSSSSSLDLEVFSTAAITMTTGLDPSTSSPHIPSSSSSSSSSLTVPVLSAGTEEISTPSTSVSLPHGTSSGGTTPAGILPNTTKSQTKSNSSHTAGEEDRLRRDHTDDTLTTPAIIGIGFGAAATALVIIGVVLLLLKRKAYRRNKHDSSNFWDDNVTLSYINSHAEFPKDLDAEMMSLDDDSFLNSLDSMTFANLWAADTAKHTNF